MSDLYFLVGVPGSGKSYWAKHNQESLNAKIYSSDEYREKLLNDVNNQNQNDKVFKSMHKDIKNALINGENVIYDATGIKLKSRINFLSEISRIENVNKYCIIFATRFEDCIERNSSRERSVPEDVISRMITQFQIPYKEEGWDDIIVVNTEQKFIDNLLALMLNDMKDFDQKTKHHTDDLLTHCRKVSNQMEDDFFKLVGLLHDSGKLMSQSFDEDGNAHYYNHENIGTYFILTLLNPEGIFRDTESFLNFLFYINYHMMPFRWENEKTKTKWINRFGKYKFDKLIKLHEADKSR